MTRRSHGRWSISLAAIVLCFIAGCRNSGNSAPPPTVLISKIGTAAASEKPPTIFATYNVHWLSNPAGVRADLARLSRVSAWAFQEVRGDLESSLPTRLVNVLPPGEWHMAWMPLNRLRELNSDDAEGQAIVSRYPIHSAEVWELRTVNGKRRFALAAVLEVNGTDVLFVNTDHQPSLFSPTRDNAKQARRLMDYLAEDGGRSTIVAGDFNTAGCIPRLVSARGDRADLRRAMSAAGFQPVLLKDVRTFHSGPYSASLDHIFVRGLNGAGSGVDESATGSDHRPAWCEVEIGVTAKSSTSRIVSPAGP